MKTDPDAPAFPITLPMEAIQRLRQMRHTAKYRGQVAPSQEEMEALVPADLVCPCCTRKMNWLRRDGNSTVVTIQHDRSGQVRLICQACNTRHAQQDADSFYDIPLDHKSCPSCKKILPLSAFWTQRNRWKDKYTYCKDCGTSRTRTRRQQVAAAYNAYQRAYRARRKADGSPVLGGDHKRGDALIAALNESREER